MESLLRWGIENSDSNAPAPPQRLKELDPDIIDMILGKPDSVLMKEALAIGLDETATLDARVTALDDFEMLVEQIDNAKNLTPLQMYPQLLSLLSQHHPDEVRMQALWILGTAVQNNPEAQVDFLKHDPIPLILSILSPSDSSSVNRPSSATRSKAAYALSGTVKHSAEAVKRLEEIGGWDVLRNSLQDSDITIRRKVVFMINALLLPNVPAVQQTSLPAPLELTAPPDGPIQPPGLTNTGATALPESSNHDATVHLPQHVAVEPTSTTDLARAALQRYQVIPVLVDSLTSPLPHGPDADQEIDSDYTEKAARTLVTYLEVGGTLSDREKDSLLNATIKETTKEAWGLDDGAWSTLLKHIRL